MPLDGYGEATNKQKQDMQRAWAKHEIDAADLPPLERNTHSLYQKETILYQTNSAQLRLSLGKRMPVVDGRLRTASRYWLTRDADQIKIEAESVLSDQDLTSDIHPKVVILKDASSDSFFIAEWQSWTTWRYILMSPSPSISADRHSRMSRSTVYFGSLGIEQDPAEDLPAFLGIHAGTLYLKLDERIYAIPMKTLKTTTNLGFTIG